MVGSARRSEPAPQQEVAAPLDRALQRADAQTQLAQVIARSCVTDRSPSAARFRAGSLSTTPRLARTRFVAMPLGAPSRRRIADEARTRDAAAWSLVADPLSGRYQRVTGLPAVTAPVFLRCRMGRFVGGPRDAHVNGHTTTATPPAGATPGARYYDVEIALSQQMGARVPGTARGPVPGTGSALGEALIAERLIEELSHARLLIEAQAGTTSPSGSVGARLTRLRAQAAALSGSRVQAAVMTDYGRLLVAAGATQPAWRNAVENILNEKAVADHVNSVSRLGARPNRNIAQELRGNLADAMALRDRTSASGYDAFLASLEQFLDALDRAPVPAAAAASPTP